MGITTAPSTGAIMRSLPLHKAGVGSAVNDTTRELGGALGVAVMGSLVASHFRSSMQGAVSGLPGEGDALAGRGAAVRGRDRRGEGRRDRRRGADLLRRRLQRRRCGWPGGGVVASGLVAWLLRPKATAKADAMVAAESSSATAAEATTG